MLVQSGDLLIALRPAKPRRSQAAERPGLEVADHLTLARLEKAALRGGRIPGFTGMRRGVQQPLPPGMPTRGVIGPGPTGPYALQELASVITDRFALEEGGGGFRSVWNVGPGRSAQGPDRQHKSAAGELRKWLLESRVGGHRQKSAGNDGEALLSYTAGELI
jgi:hypothetical protein